MATQQLSAALPGADHQGQCPARTARGMRTPTGDYMTCAGGHAVGDPHGAAFGSAGWFTWTDDQAGTAPRPSAARIAQLRESIARRALASIGTPAGARILRVVRTGAVLTVATEQPGGYFPYCVDSFRLPTPAETDPDQVDPYTPGQWILADQHGDHIETDVERMIAEATAYAATIREVAVTR